MRIASLSPAITEILFALNFQEDIVCTDQFSNFPEEVGNIPHLTGHAKIDLRDIRDHEVDLVFTLGEVQEELGEQLKQIDFSVSHHNPRTINAVYEMIRNLGMILQVENKAAELVLQMQQGFKDVKRKSGLLPRRQRVYIEGCKEPWVTEVAHIAGLELISDETNADFVVSNNGRIIDEALLNRPGPRLAEGCRYLYGWAFEVLH